MVIWVVPNSMEGHKIRKSFPPKWWYIKEKFILQNWTSTDPPKIRPSFLPLRNLKQIYCKTSRNIQNVIIRIEFEIITFIFEATMAMRQAKFCQEHLVHAYPFFKIWFFLEIWSCLGQNLSGFLSLPWILHNPYCHCRWLWRLIFQDLMILNVTQI